MLKLRCSDYESYRELADILLTTIEREPDRPITLYVNDIKQQQYFCAAQKLLLLEHNINASEHVLLLGRLSIFRNVTACTKQDKDFEEAFLAHNKRLFEKM